MAMELTLLSPSSFKVLFDFTFFFTYVVGWIVTSIYQPEFMWNNNVARVFLDFNICVGVDSFPAQPIASVTGAISMSFLFGVVIAYFEKINLTLHHGHIVLRKSLFVVSWVFMLTFMLTYSVRPDNFIMTMIHAGAFASGCLGYFLFQVATILEFAKFSDNPVTHKTRRGALWLGAQIGMAVMLFAMFWYLIFELVFVARKDMLANIDSTKIPAVVSGGPDNFSKDQVKFDWKGDLLVVAVFLGPVIASLNQPEPLWPTGSLLISGTGNSDKGDAEAELE